MHMKKEFLTPLSIVVSGLLIASALYFALSARNDDLEANKIGKDNAVEQNAVEQLEKLNEITESDHIKGDKKAPLKLVEYSDFECPFCKRFHSTMNQILKEYDGKIAWVYRQFPLVQLHPKNAYKAALASECVAKLGDNNSFWDFTDKYFDLTPSNDTIDFDKILRETSKAAGIDVNKIKSCMEESEIKVAVEEDIQNAIETGGRGTPWSILISKDGKKIPVNGALPYEQLKQIIEYALEN